MAPEPLSNEKSAARRQRRQTRYLRGMTKKSSKSGAFLTGKIIPSAVEPCAKRLEREGTAHRFTSNTKTGGLDMYIGLGGLLILILILWLLGVI
jgi:hypothetical protein